MKISETVDRNSISKKISDTFLTVIDLFCNKYLFLTLLINIAIVTKPVVTAISITNGMYMYYTSETQVVGNRPCRFFGLFSFLYPDKYLFMNVFKIMYFIALVLLAWAVYLLIKRINDLDKKMAIMFAVDIPVILIFQSSDRQVLSLAFLFALIAVAFSVYFLLYGNGMSKYFALILACIAVIIDVRLVYLCIIVSIVFLRNKHSTRKVKNISGMIFLLTVTLTIASAVVTNDNKSSEDVKKYFEVHYSEEFKNEEVDTDDEIFNDNAFIGNNPTISEGFFKVTAFDLLTGWIPEVADTLISFLYEDIFQGLCYIYIPVILIYNHLTVPEEKKKGIIEGNND